MRILGIDPGSRICGIGLIETSGNSYKHLFSTAIKLPANIDFNERLVTIFKTLSKIVQELKPDEAAIEKIFMAENASSAMKLGHARGSAIVAVKQCGIPLFEYSPLEIKQAVTSHGKAGKEQVGKMVEMLLGLDLSNKTEDESDSLAIALCHAFTRGNAPELHSAK